VFTVVVLALTAATLCLIILDLKAPLYSAAIDSVSGLDDADLGYRSTDLNPLFNLPGASLAAAAPIRAPSWR
jgi:hypothetical protein